MVLSWYSNTDINGFVPEYFQYIGNGDTAVFYKAIDMSYRDQSPDST